MLTEAKEISFLPTERASETRFYSGRYRPPYVTIEGLSQQYNVELLLEAEEVPFLLVKSARKSEIVYVIIIN